MSTIIEGIAAYKVTDNDNVIDKAYFQMEYDGEDFNMTGVKNNQLVIMSMTNDEIMELLAENNLRISNRNDYREHRGRGLVSQTLARLP